MKKTEIKKTNQKIETAEGLKKEAASKNAVKKGYNEKNPTQPQGAFKPDGKK